MKKTLVGTNEDGSPHYSYAAEEGEIAVLTGPIVAVLTTADGTVYDVSEPVVAVAPEHHDELHALIGDYYEQNGHAKMTDPAVPFVHTRAGAKTKTGKD